MPGYFLHEHYFDVDVVAGDDASAVVDGMIQFGTLYGFDWKIYASRCRVPRTSLAVGALLLVVMFYQFRRAM